jgi:hypothetical protein
MAKLEPVFGNAPIHWACYLIYGDASALEQEDIEQADKFAAWLGGDIVDCTSEDDANHPGFMRYHDAQQFGTLAADCAQYTALVEQSQ